MLNPSTLVTNPLRMRVTAIFPLFGSAGSKSPAVHAATPSGVLSPCEKLMNAFTRPSSETSKPFALARGISAAASRCTKPALANETIDRSHFIFRRQAPRIVRCALFTRYLHVEGGDDASRKLGAPRTHRKGTAIGNTGPKTGQEPRTCAQCVSSGERYLQRPPTRQLRIAILPG